MIKSSIWPKEWSLTDIANHNQSGTEEMAMKEYPAFLKATKLHLMARLHDTHIFIHFGNMKHNLAVLDGFTKVVNVTNLIRRWDA